MGLSLEALNAALGELSRQGIWRQGDRQVAFRELTEMASRLLDVERCSIWLYDDARTRIICADLFIRSTGAHTSGSSIGQSLCPKYFEAVEEVRTIAAHDARTDPRTHELAEGYLDGLGITSMLDTPLVVQGRCIGVVCLEHVGPARTWSAVEQTFAGSVGDFAALATEAAELHAAQQALRHKEKTLRLTLHDLELVLHAASHDLRTPALLVSGFQAELAAALGEARQAARGGNLERMEALFDNEIAEALGYIESGAIQMGEVLGGLLTISRVGQQALKLTDVDMDGVAGRAVAAVESDLVQTGGSIVVSPMPRCHGDADLLELGLIEALRNAIQFRSPGRPLQIRVGGQPLEDGYARYTVTDNGMGLAEAHRRTAFDAFKRHDPEHSEGLGLGLSLIRRVVLSHGGRTWLESAEGPGLRLCLMLPQMIGQSEG